MILINIPKKYVKNTIFDLVRPLYIYSRLFGMFPFSIDIDTKLVNSKVYICKFDICLYILQLAICIFLIMFNIKFNLHAYQSHSYLQVMGPRIILIFGLCANIVWVLLDIINRHRIWKIVKMFYEFDLQVNKHFNFINFNKILILYPSDSITWLNSFIFKA